MPKEIIISASADQSRIAIVENGDLVELYVENPENVRTIGDIYLGRVRKILPGIKAAFVDVGLKQDAFLHFSDLSDELPGLLELAEGRVKERSSEGLSKEPSGDEDLEAESPEEQLAAKRRRDLKRSKPSRSRRDGKAAATEQAPKDQASSKAEPAAKPQRRSRRSAPPDVQAKDAVPGAPAILPPEAAEEQSLDAPAGAEAAPQQQEAAEAQTEERPRPRRRRGRRRRAPQDEAAGTADESGQADEPAPQEKAKRRATPRKRQPEQQAEGQAEAAPGKRESKKAAAKATAEKPATEKATNLPGPGAGVEETAESTGSPVLKRSSRYLIDLTGSAPRREEEEEEEERAKSSRRKTRSGRGGGRKKSGDDNRKSSSQNRGRGRGSAPSTSNGRPLYDYLKQDQRILVKIIKEPISSKGSRVSTDVSLAGRFLVLVPTADYVAVSKKIESAKERRRLRALARSLLPEGLGLIVRTVAAGRDAKTLDMDLQLLLDKWRKIEDQLRKRPEPPAKLYEDVSMVSSIIRDLFSEDYDRIVVDDPKLYRNIRSYVQAVVPQMADAVKLHQRKEPVFRTHNIEKDIRAAFETRVPLPGGGYLFIEHTEAMHVIDVNSGRAGRGLSQEENALKVNLEAAREIAKQLRLRDLGGIICVDFIDMRRDNYRRKLFDELKREFSRDRAVTKMLPLSDFGVMEITRQRLRPSITTTLDVEDLGELPQDEELQEDTAPQTAAQPRTATDVVGHLDRWLKSYREEVQERHAKRPILIRVHPFLAAYLQRGIPSLLTRWRFKTRLRLKLDVDESVDPLSFSVRDEKSGKNLTRKYDPDRRGG